MAYTEAERVEIRRYLGRGAAWLDSGLESAVTATQSQADGGQRADASTEVMLRGLLTSLASVEARLADLHESMVAVQIETIKIDTARAMLTLRSEGRRYVGQLADTLETTPRRDVFSPAEYG